MNKQNQLLNYRCRSSKSLETLFTNGTSYFEEPLNVFKNPLHKYQSSIDHQVEGLYKEFETFKKLRNLEFPQKCHFPVKQFQENSCPKSGHFHFSKSKKLDPCATFVPKQIDSIQNCGCQASPEKVMLLKKRISYSKKVAHLNQKSTSKRAIPAVTAINVDCNHKEPAINELGTKQDCKLIRHNMMLPPTELRSGVKCKPKGGTQLHQSNTTSSLSSSSTSRNIHCKWSPHETGRDRRNSCGRLMVPLPDCFKFKQDDRDFDESGRKLFVNEPRRNQIAENDANKLDRVSSSNSSDDLGNSKSKMRKRQAKVKPSLEDLEMKYEIAMIYVNELMKEMNLNDKQQRK